MLWATHAGGKLLGRRREGSRCLSASYSLCGHLFCLSLPRAPPLRADRSLYDLPIAGAGRGGACRAAGHQLTFSFESSPALVTLPVPLLAPLLWAPALEGADTAGHWLPPLRNHGSGGSVPALGGGSGIFASRVSGSQARLMLLAFFGDQLLEEGDGGLRRKKKNLSPKADTRGSLRPDACSKEAARGWEGAEGLCLTFASACPTDVTVQSPVSPHYCRPDSAQQR